MLSLLYLLGFTAMGVGAVAIGLCVAPAPRRDSLALFVCDLMTRWALGMAMVSSIVVWLGLVGLIRVWTVGPILVALTLGGTVRSVRAGLFRGSIPCDGLRGEWRLLSDAGRVLAIVVMAWGLLLSANVVVGSMVPDMGQDTMWYHLSVPGQWAFEGDVRAWPSVMPSCYSLGREAIYAAILLFGDEILCSLLAAQATLVFLWGMVFVTARLVGWRAAGLIAATGVVFSAQMVAMAPLGVKNDALAGVLLLAAFVELMARLKTDDPAIDMKRSLAIGFLLGAATAVKVPVGGFWAPVVMCYLVALACQRRGIGVVLREAITLGIGVGLAYSPWAIRGWMTTGLPVFPPIGPLFTIRPEYEAALAAVQQQNSLYPLTLDGLTEGFLRQFPHKIQLAMVNVDIMFGMVYIAALGVVWRREAFWRVQGVALLSFYGLLGMLKGGEQMVRYFAICYPLAAPALGQTLDDICRRVSRPVRIGFIALLFVGGVASYARKQVDIAGFHTNQWRFRPVVTESQRRQFASHAETGDAYLGFAALQELIPEEARVLVIDTWAPHYLKRRCLWGDPMIARQLTDQWLYQPSGVAREFLESNAIDFVVRTKPTDDEWHLGMEQAGVLRSIELPDAPELDGWRLQAVVSD